MPHSCPTRRSSDLWLCVIISPLEHAHDFQKVFGLTRLAATIDKAEGALETLEHETLDYCKCVIEIVCKPIISERGIPYDDINLPRLVNMALSFWGFDKEGLAGTLSGGEGAIG